MTTSRFLSTILRIGAPILIIVGAASCAVPTVARTATLSTSTAAPAPRFSHEDPADDCPKGEIFTESGGPFSVLASDGTLDEIADCDLVGGANTLNVFDIDEDYANDLGCAYWEADVIAGTGYNCDF